MGIIDVGEYTEERKKEEQGDKEEDMGGEQSLIKKLNSLIIHTGVDPKIIDWGFIIMI